MAPRSKSSTDGGNFKDHEILARILDQGLPNFPKHPEPDTATTPSISDSTAAWMKAKAGTIRLDQAEDVALRTSFNSFCRHIKDGKIPPPPPVPHPEGEEQPAQRLQKPLERLPKLETSKREHLASFLNTTAIHRMLITPIFEIAKLYPDIVAFAPAIHDLQVSGEVSTFDREAPRRGDKRKWVRNDKIFFAEVSDQFMMEVPALVALQQARWELPDPENEDDIGVLTRAQRQEFESYQAAKKDEIKLLENDYMPAHFKPLGYAQYIKEEVSRLIALLVIEYKAIHLLDNAAFANIVKERFPLNYDNKTTARSSGGSTLRLPRAPNTKEAALLTIIGQVARYSVAYGAEFVYLTDFETHIVFQMPITQGWSSITAKEATIKWFKCPENKQRWFMLWALYRGCGVLHKIKNDYDARIGPAKHLRPQQKELQA
uniref:Reverse transcriptase RNase H-like domain-containing protein n=1 Tax=Mycena chlorophos TaxID=658473 RepID=A0ABQ0LYC8_MYCCL|nr:predicted protein [Mycena chlorophos]